MIILDFGGWVMNRFGFGSRDNGNFNGYLIKLGSLCVLLLFCVFFESLRITCEISQKKVLTSLHLNNSL